jgi:hypothetical protein
MSALVRVHVLVLAMVWGIACTIEQPCVQSGDAIVFVPESRVEMLTDIQVDGPCEVFAPASACDAGGDCLTEADGGLVRRYRVAANERATCVVSLSFSDGCQEIYELKFGGPMNNCCSEICLRGSVTSSMGCDLDGGA